jgi:hypothetical protein
MQKSPSKHSPFKPHTTKIDQEASKQKRSRSEWVELPFESFLKQPEQVNKIE